MNGVTTTYYHVGGRLYGENIGYNKLIYLYDDTGSPYGYIYNYTEYYFERNAQGDVVALFNTNGVIESWNRGIPDDPDKANAVHVSELSGITHLYSLLVQYGPLMARYAVTEYAGHVLIVTGVDLTHGLVYTNNPNAGRNAVKGVQTYAEFLDSYTGRNNYSELSELDYIGTNWYW